MILLFVAFLLNTHLNFKKPIKPGLFKKKTIGFSKKKTCVLGFLQKKTFFFSPWSKHYHYHTLSISNVMSDEINKKNCVLNNYFNINIPRYQCLHLIHEEIKLLLKVLLIVKSVINC